MIAQTSIESYHRISEHELSEQQQTVLIALSKTWPANNRMISEHLSSTRERPYPINRVTPRINELRKKGVVSLYDKLVDPVTQRKTMFWKVNA